MASETINIPSSQSGLISYNNLPSDNKLQISPTVVTVLIVVVVIAEAAIRLIF